MQIRLTNGILFLDLRKVFDIAEHEILNLKTVFFGFSAIPNP